MKFNLISLFALVLLLSSCTNQLKEISKNVVLSQKIDSLLSYCSENGMFNGSIVVTKNDTILFSESYGYKNNESKEKIDTESNFYIASVSKQFTAMGILILAERKQLSVDDKFKKFFPDLTMFNKEMTIRQLLNHTSGVTDGKYYQLEKPSNQTVFDALKSQGESEFGTPGEAFRYSNSGYILLAMIIEKVTGTPIDQFLQKEIFTPLNMTRTTASKSKLEAMENQVNAYNVIGRESKYQSSVIGPAGIYSTVNDLQKWNKGLNQNSLVSKKSLNLAFENGIENGAPISFKMLGDNYGYGFGWALYTKDQNKFVQHDGSVEGYRSLIRKNLSTGDDYMMLTNHGSALAMDGITRALDAILGESEYALPEIPISTRIVNELKTNNIDIAVAKAREIINNKAEESKPEERVLGILAFTFLKEKMYKEAIGIFKLNVELYPNSPSAHSSLGEGYLADEQYEKAKECYQKRLELNPTSEYTKRKLKTIEEKIK